MYIYPTRLVNSGWCRYNWQQFSVVTSDVAGHDDFVQVSDHLLPLALVSKIYMSSAAESSPKMCPSTPHTRTVHVITVHNQHS